MLLSVDKGHTGFNFWDAKRCLVPSAPVWVNSETAEWGGYTGQCFGHVLEVAIHQEESITIYLDKKLIIFNEVDDCSESEVTEQELMSQ